MYKYIILAFLCACIFIIAYIIIKIRFHNRNLIEKFYNEKTETSHDDAIEDGDTDATEDGDTDATEDGDTDATEKKDGHATKDNDDDSEDANKKEDDDGDDVTKDDDDDGDKKINYQLKRQIIEMYVSYLQRPPTKEELHYLKKLHFENDDNNQTTIRRAKVLLLSSESYKTKHPDLTLHDMNDPDTINYYDELVYNILKTEMPEETFSRDELDILAESYIKNGENVDKFVDDIKISNRYKKYKATDTVFIFDNYGKKSVEDEKEEVVVSRPHIGKATVKTNTSVRGSTTDALKTVTGSTTDTLKTETGSTTDTLKTETGSTTDALKTDTGSTTDALKTVTGSTTDALKTDTISKETKQCLEYNKKTHELSDEIHTRNLEELKYACDRSLEDYDNLDENMVLLPDQTWNIPNKRPPICTSQKCDTTPLYSQSALIGTLLDDATDTKIGSIMPKFRFTES